MSDRTPDYLRLPLFCAQHVESAASRAAASFKWRGNLHGANPWGEVRRLAGCRQPREQLAVLMSQVTVRTWGARGVAVISVSTSVAVSIEAQAPAGAAEGGVSL